MISATETARIPRLAILLTSAAALGYEVLLMRLFSIIQWHHFAYMVISLALLGYGAAGTFLTLARGFLLGRFPLAFTGSLLLFGLSAVGGFLLAQELPFNPEELPWDPQQPLYLLALYLLLALPFFCAASAIALALARFGEAVPRVYAADLLGAGLGSLGIIALLFLAHPMTALSLVGLLALAAAAAGWWESGMRPRSIALAFLLPGLLLPLLPRELILSPYKALSQALLVEGTRVLAERSSPLGLLTVVESPHIPFRHAPGLALAAGSEPPPQLGVFTDGEGMTAITRYSGERAALAYLDQLTSALPYHLARPQTVLILGAGGGAEVLQALYHDAEKVDAVELNPQLVRLVREDYADFAGGLYALAQVRVHVAEARGFVAGSTEHWDLIQLALLDSFAATSAGLYALAESYLYTIEAFADYLDRLAPDGMLAITRWVRLPPRDALRLFVTAAAALERRGVVEAGRQLVLIRGWQTSTLLVKNGVFTASEIEALRAFCRERAFDPAWYPGMSETEANRHNILDRPWFFEGARALLGAEREAFIGRYKFDIAPTTDDRPYFFQFFKWQALPEILALGGRRGMPLLEWGYLVLVATLVQAVLASLLLILLPLRLTAGQGIGRGRVVIYFAAIGLGFMFLEMAFIQRFIQFLHHPLYAAAVVLTAFLLFAGLGSACSGRLPAGKGIPLAVGGILALGFLYLFALGPLFAALAGLPVALKVVLSLALIAPLAFCMGMPFPLALTRLGTAAPSLMPWAYGVNGCSSVIAAVLAPLLAIHFGFGLVVLTALGLYALAATIGRA
ncbi:MAG TPA: SAM-dependent methyltransferase [Candidatus Competibacteraceae bacterium]|nr:SAM-dependent methyltransferase [Candidatus Competibacteraceae bacterium]